MALLTVGQIVRRVQVMLDDPAGRRFSSDYIMPHLDQENESYEVSLERMGVQQQERIAIFNLAGASGTLPVDLAPLFQPGQPLQWLLRPKRLDWKQTGQPDASYVQSDAVNELDDVPVGNIGALQYRWAAGSIQLTPSATPLTIRLYFFALANDVYDNAQSVMRGIGFILARQVACSIAALNNNMGKLAEKLQKDLARDKQNLSNLIVMQQQAQTLVPRGTQGRNLIRISSGGSPLL